MNARPLMGQKLRRNRATGWRSHIFWPIPLMWERHPVARKGSFSLRLLTALLCLVATGLRAGELLGARFELKPERPYVNQPFELHLFIDVSPGAELQDLSLDGVPMDSFATMQPFQTSARSQAKHGDRTVDVLHFMSTGRALRPSLHDVAGVLRAMIVERRSLGFFSSWNKSQGAIRVQPFRIEFRALPSVGTPPDFAGVVGVFTLSGRADATHVSPGDLVTMEYRLTGSGWLGQAPLLLPDLGAGFRTYPPQEVQRDESGSLTVRQVVIPLTTNATLIGAARLPYFDPAAGVYREAVAGPFRLAVSPTSGDAHIPAIKRVDVQPGPSTPGDFNDATTIAAVGHARRLAPFAAVLLLAMLVAGGLYGRRPRVAIAAGIVIFVAGAYLVQRWSERTRPASRELRETTAARLCPSVNARVLFRVAMGRQVVPIETTEGWVRVEADGQHGWIPATALKNE